MKRTPLARTKQLQRGKPIKAKPRSKGSRSELEVIEILKAHGYHTARRNWMSGGMGGADIMDGIPGFSIEVKNQQRLNIWACMAQCEAAASPTETPLLVYRRNGTPFWASMPFEDVLGLIEEAQS